MKECLLRIVAYLTVIILHSLFYEVVFVRDLLS